MTRTCNQTPAPRHLATLLFLLVFFTATTTQAQNNSQKHLPIIDVHVHAMKMNPAFASDMCPWFLSSMPGADPSDPRPSFVSTDCANPLKAYSLTMRFGFSGWTKVSINKDIERPSGIFRVDVKTGAFNKSYDI